MRVSRDAASYRASGVRVRDARHVHNGPNVPKHRSGKDTKRWCGGKVGREHKPVCVVKREWTASPSGENHYQYVHACTVCGKELAFYFTSWSRSPAPDWVLRFKAQHDRT